MADYGQQILEKLADEGYPFLRGCEKQPLLMGNFRVTERIEVGAPIDVVHNSLSDFDVKREGDSLVYRAFGLDHSGSDGSLFMDYTLEVRSAIC